MGKRLSKEEKMKRVLRRINYFEGEMRRATNHNYYIGTVITRDFSDLKKINEINPKIAEAMINVGWETYRDLYIKSRYTEIAGEMFSEEIMRAPLSRYMRDLFWKRDYEHGPEIPIEWVEFLHKLNPFIVNEDDLCIERARARARK